MSDPTNPAKGKPLRAWQRMLSGRRLDLLNPSALDVEFEDIAHGLARVARWNGQTNGRHAFSVAQHSLLVEQVCRHLLSKPTSADCLYALLHDAPEYVIGDMISPFKAVVGGAYKEIEDRLAGAIHLRAGLEAQVRDKLKRTIKQADRNVAYFEAVTLAGFDPDEAHKFFGRPKGLNAEMLDLNPWDTSTAQGKFLERLHELDPNL